MARKKEVITSNNETDSSNFIPADESITEKLGEAFEKIISRDYGYTRAPKPYMTPFGIQHLDALLGGGIVSSAPVVLSSTPETGKSTFAFQFSKQFQLHYPNSIIVYLDVEGAGNTSNNTSSRIEIFCIDQKRFRYEPIMIDIYGFFHMVETLVNIKKQFEDKLQKEFKIMIIWDSIAATSCSKINDADDPNRIIGVKARQLSFCIEKYAPILAYNRITFLTIDQVRANIQMEGPYVAKEKSVGTWNDYKAASSVVAFNHKVSQWLYLSRKTAITPNDGMGISGWYLNITTEKNKNAPSQESVMCVFDKRTGLHKFWSEYTFLSEMTRSELKYFKEEKNLPYPLSIKKSGPQIYLEFIDPVTKNSNYCSEKMYRKNAYDKYLNDENFRNAFDYVMSTAVEQRITSGLFQLKTCGLLQSINTSSVDEDIITHEDITTHEDMATHEKLEDEIEYEPVFKD